MSLPIIDRSARVQYIATAGQTQFTVPFEFFAATDLKVYAGETPINTGFAVSGAGIQGGGYLTFTVGRSAGEVITIIRDIPIDRTSDFPVSGPFPIAALNEQLARLIAQIQQVETVVERRCLQLTPFDTAVAVQVPGLTARANKYLKFTADGTIVAEGLDEMVLPATGPEGPSAWAAPVAWATATAYTAVAPRSVVVQAGESYVCLVSHTSGAFATDLAAGKWIKVAAKGTDGSGAPAWGTITGTLSSQTDLQAALAGKAATGSNGDITKLTALAGGSTTDVAVRFGANNAGLYYPSAGVVAVVTGGTERLRFLTGGGITSENVAAAVGYKGIVSNAKSAAHTLVAGDMGTSVDITTGGVTIPDGLPDGFACQVFNNSASAQTVAKSGTEVMRRVAGATATNLTLAAYGKAFIEKRGSIILISGDLT
jgi:hypothetical protein